MTIPDTLLSIARAWLAGFQVDLTRYIIAAPLVWLVICVLLAPVLKTWKIREDRPPALQHIVELLCSIRSVAVFSTVTLITLGLHKAGLLWGEAFRETPPLIWTAVSLLLTILAHDAYFYWVHRAMHRPLLFRAFHRRHHRSNNPTPFTAYSFDLGEAALMAAFSPLWLLLVPVGWPAFGLFMLHQIARNVIGHSGYELFPARRDGRPMFDWMTTVTHHDLHHAQAGSNFGLYFTWWDRWMNTENPRYLEAFARVAARRRGQVKAAAISAG